MGIITRGDGSSPSGPTIRKRDRDRLADYDRAIHYLDLAIVEKSRFRRSELSSVVAKRRAIDVKRRELRAWMKGYVDLR